MYHPLWEQADDEFCSNGGLGIFVRLIDLYVIACAIGIKEDKVVLDSDIANPLSSPKTIGRNTHRENLDIRDMMDFMLQNALLNSKTIDFGDDERLKLAFNPDYSNKKINAASFLTGFATYGLTQIYGEYGFGPFKMSARQEILRRLLLLQKETNFNLITIEELKMIDTLWDLEGDLTRRSLVDIYHDVYGTTLSWDEYKKPLYDADVIEAIKDVAESNEIPFELISKLIVTINANKYIARSAKLKKEFDRLINQEWIHFENVKEGLIDEN